VKRSKAFFNCAQKEKADSIEKSFLDDNWFKGDDVEFCLPTREFAEAMAGSNKAWAKGKETNLGIEQGWPKCGPPKIFSGPCVKFWMHNSAIYDKLMYENTQNLHQFIGYNEHIEHTWLV